MEQGTDFARYRWQVSIIIDRWFEAGYASMARVIFIEYTRHSVSFREDGVAVLGELSVVNNMPVILRINGFIWEEAGAYLAHRANDVAIGLINIRTLHSIAWRLHAYLAFCEQEAIDPMLFGTRRDEKPTYRYYGYLIRQRRGDEKKRLMTSTASARINAVVTFYRWLMTMGLLPDSARPFIPKRVYMYSHDNYGHAHAHPIISTDLVIRRGLQHGTVLEGRLYPVTRKIRDQLIRSAYEKSSPEFALMLDLGFRTGMRIQTICGLTIKALSLAYPGDILGTHYLRVGPKNGVPTKLGVNYTVQIPSELLERLWSYVSSSRRSLRGAQSKPEDGNLIFLTRFGLSYCPTGRDSSTSINQELHRLRNRHPDLDLRDFHFHCTRATFGTSIVLAGLESGERVDKVVNRVRQLLGHKRSETSLAYIKFVEELRTNSAIDSSIVTSL